MHSSDPLKLKSFDLAGLPLLNPFWQFSLQQWKSTALQRQLIALQNERGQRINLLLLSMWFSFEHKDIRPYLNALIDASQAWHEHIVAPLRTARQMLPQALPEPCHQLKQHIQACELQAEQVEQAILYQHALHCETAQTAKQQPDYDSLDWLIINLSASELAQTDLFLLIQNCLPSYPAARIQARLDKHSQA